MMIINDSEVKEQMKNEILKCFNRELRERLESMASALLEIGMSVQDSISLISKMYDNMLCGHQSVVSITNRKKEATIYDKFLLDGLAKFTSRELKISSCPKEVLSSVKFKDILIEGSKNNGILLFSHTVHEKNIIDLIDTASGTRGKDALSPEQEIIIKNLHDLFKNKIIHSDIPCIFYNFDEKTISKIEGHFDVKFATSIVYEKEFLFKDAEQVFLDALKENNCTYEDGYQEYLFSYYQENKFIYNEHTFFHYKVDILKLLKNNVRKGIFKNDDFYTVPIFKKINSVDIDALFKGLVGMDNIKSTMNEVRAYYNLKTRMAIYNATNIDMRLHLLLTGNPGTGKTTIAKIYSDFLKELGVISNHGFIEVSADDFVSKWVGDSILKASNIISQFKGNVIFIDEAYAIAMNSHGVEALSVIIKEMEKNTEETIFVFAGYKKEMQAFLNANSGLKSRISFHVEMSDYTDEQLCEIFRTKIENAGFKISKECLNYVQTYIADKNEEKTSGNGRFVENLVNDVIMKHAHYVYINKITTNINEIRKESIFTENVHPLHLITKFA